MKTIYLTTRDQLNVYMSPVRQELMHILNISQDPLTAKALAVRLRISPSCVQRHLKKLLDLGPVEADHKAVINVITATYYGPSSVEVRVGLERDDGLREQREAVTCGIVKHTLQEFLHNTREFSDLSAEELSQYGNLFSGVIYLETEDRIRLTKQIKSFLKAHGDSKKEGAEHWSFVVTACRGGGEK